MPDPVVLYEVDDKVSVITLNRPDKLNAISPELMRQLLDAFARADADTATSVVLMRAEGGSPTLARATGAAIRSRRTNTSRRSSHSR